MSFIFWQLSHKNFLLLEAKQAGGKYIVPSALSSTMQALHSCRKTAVGSCFKQWKA